MGSGFFDDQQLTFQCPGCGYELQERIGRLKRNPEIPCPGCGKAIAVQADDLRRGLEGAEQQLDELSRSLSQTIKIEF